MLLKGKCKKCGNYLKFDIGTMDRNEVETELKSFSSWQCTAGNHVENMSPFELYDFDWDNLSDDSAMTEDEFLNELKSQFKEVYSDSEFGDRYIVDSFAMGKCLCHPKDGDEDDMLIFDFIHSPKGKRYYYLIV